MKENLFANLPNALAQEWIERLAGNQHVRIERIVSTGQASPPGFWYDQEQAEWVVLLRGKAELQFKGEAKPRQLEPGDHVLIQPHQQHRVESTSSGEPTVWLAVFYCPMGTP